jgi:uracil-DNA glycosylase family 4
VALYRRLSEAHVCPLASDRTRLVFGAGNADAELMFVGEAPGAEEDRQGKPFVGRAGKLLDALLEEIGLRRGDAFVANVLKCLSYSAQVQLGDGSWERIGRLVRSRYSGEVMSVDDDGRLVPRRVVGWHATPVAGRSVHRLTYRSAKKAGLGRVGVQLTGDHPVLTERGYVPVEKLGPEDRVATGQGLSSLALDVVCGTLLGDGHLNAASAHLSFSHSVRQADYAFFKADLLAELKPRVDEMEVAAVAGGSRNHAIVQARTLAHRALGTLRRDFYRPRKIVPAWLADALTARMLAFWFMDDGYTRLRPGRQPLAEIASVNFDEADLQVLLRALGRIGLSAKASRGRLYFNVQETRMLSERIAPYVPPSMRYKLHPEVEARVAFDPAQLQPGAPESLFDAVEVEDVSDRPRADRTFFCIDVEETHNFVTAGGVLRNCRPPGNRDPLPEEIEECSPWLFRQIELIEPLVICTLGNFATKLLTGSKTGITKVHGTSQTHELGGRSVQLYPIFHPAAALRTEAVRELLRADFARLPALLEEARTGARSEGAVVPPELGPGLPKSESEAARLSADADPGGAPASAEAQVSKPAEPDTEATAADRSQLDLFD